MQITRRFLLLAATFCAQAAASRPAPAQDLPKRRPEEMQADPLRAYDIDKDGTLDLAEVKSAAAAHFDELNHDGDDSLDRREAAKVLRGGLFRKTDTDSDGTVDKAEYLALIERMFNRADTEHDGKLDRTELDSPAGKALLRLLR